MRSKVISSSPTSEKNSEDRATAAMLTVGGADGIPAFALRHWRPEGGSTMPVFITWLLGVGRFCLTVKYGRYSLKGAEWRIDTGPGARSTPSPLDQARMEALQVSQALQRRLNRSAPVSPVLAFFDMERDRRIERIARRSGVPVLWDLERYTGKLAEAATGARFRHPLEKPLVLEEISALVEDAPSVAAGAFRPTGRRS